MSKFEKLFPYYGAAVFSEVLALGNAAGGHTLRAIGSATIGGYMLAKGLQNRPIWRSLDGPQELAVFDYSSETMDAQLFDQDAQQAE